MAKQRETTPPASKKPFHVIIEAITETKAWDQTRKIHQYYRKEHTKLFQGEQRNWQFSSVLTVLEMKQLCGV